MVSCGSSGRHRYLETWYVIHCSKEQAAVSLKSLLKKHAVSATATTATMLHYRSFIQFREHVRWLFTLGLALSSAVDVLITSSLFMLLRRSKMEGGSLDGVIDTLILYTFETGSVTCAATIVSMICWISIPTQLIFMALHFIIGKCSIHGAVYEMFNLEGPPPVVGVQLSSWIIADPREKAKT
ncbi:hypothetical protein HHX47_DHR1001759 [Lentinula edodes]|nr:hypothetical protein HHX47_DHR1001759 [Lentinula edodes]